MVKLTGKQTIEGFGPRAVFNAGAMVENLPSVDGIELDTKDETILEKGTEIGVIFNLSVPIPGLATNFKLHSQVVEVRRDARMLIMGMTEDEIVRASLLLELEKMRGRDATLVRHSLDVTFEGRRRTMAMSIPAKLALEPKIADFSEAHVANIEHYLGAKAVKLDKKQPRVAALGSAAA